jgi:hypothetical protein
MLHLIALLTLSADGASGFFSAERVRELIGESVDECFTGAPTGEAHFSFTIAPDGSVRGAKLLEKKALDEVRVSCVTSALERFQFPMTRGETKVEWTFRKSALLPASDDVVFGLEASQLLPPVQAASDKVRECYEVRLRENNALAGRVEVQFVVAPNGMVIEVAVTEDTMKDPAVARCVQGVVLGLRFPKARNGKTTEVAYPFVFAPIAADAGVQEKRPSPQPSPR